MNNSINVSLLALESHKSSPNHYKKMIMHAQRVRFISLLSLEWHESLFISFFFPWCNHLGRNITLAPILTPLKIMLYMIQVGLAIKIGGWLNILSIQVGDWIQALVDGLAFYDFINLLGVNQWLDGNMIVFLVISS